MNPNFSFANLVSAQVFSWYPVYGLSMYSISASFPNTEFHASTICLNVVPFPVPTL